VSPEEGAPGEPHADDDLELLAEEADGAGDDEGAPSVEALITDLEAVTARAEEYLNLAKSKQAEFENFRKRMMKQQADEVARASGRLVESLLPVLDAFDYGVAHGDGSLAPLRDQMLVALEKEGLTRVEPAAGDAFDPTEHDAVAQEPGDGGEPLVAESLRAGYRWQGHLLRPVMVRVKS
jgi:molecular chaperone GrpE